MCDSEKTWACIGLPLSPLPLCTKNTLCNEEEGGSGMTVVPAPAASAALRHWHAINISVRFTSAAQKMLEAAVRRMKAHGEATTSVASAKTLDLLQRWQQGDEAMYEESKVKERNYAAVQWVWCAAAI